MSLEIPKISIGKAVGYFVATWIISMVIIGIAFDVDTEDMPLVLSSLALTIAFMTPTLILLFRQVNFLSQVDQYIQVLQSNLTINREHLSTLKQQHSEQTDLSHQILDVENKLTENKLNYNQSVEAFNTALASIPLRFVAPLFNYRRKEYYSDFLI